MAITSHGRLGECGVEAVAEMSALCLVDLGGEKVVQARCKARHLQGLGDAPSEGDPRVFCAVKVWELETFVRSCHLGRRGNRDHDCDAFSNKAGKKQGDSLVRRGGRVFRYGGEEVAA